MREVEFLPGWYPQLRRRKRLAVLQAWMTVTIIGGLTLWWILAGRNVSSAEGALAALEAQVVQVKSEQQQLVELLRIKDELVVQEQMVAKLGFPVEMSRLLRTLDAVMPREMSLTFIDCSTEEKPIAGNHVSAARAKSDGERLVDRRLNVRITGVAPTDVDLANFLSGLSECRFLENIALIRAGGKNDGGYLMREFEVTFSISLNSAGEP